MEFPAVLGVFLRVTLGPTPRSHCFGNPLTIYRGLSGPPGPKPRKSPKKVCRGLWPRDPPESLEKVSKKSGESGKSLEKVPRDFFETFSRLSGGPGAGGPGRLFSDFFRVSGLEGPRDPCKWSTGSQSLLSQRVIVFGFRAF